MELSNDELRVVLELLQNTDIQGAESPKFSLQVKIEAELGYNRCIHYWIREESDTMNKEIYKCCDCGANYIVTLPEKS